MLFITVCLYLAPAFLLIAWMLWRQRTPAAPTVSESMVTGFQVTVTVTMPTPIPESIARESGTALTHLIINRLRLNDPSITHITITDPRVAGTNMSCAIDVHADLIP